MIGMTEGGVEAAPRKVGGSALQQAQLDIVTRCLRSGSLSASQACQIPEEELDAIFGAACKYLEIGRPRDALAICGYLVFLDPSDARSFQLMGVAFHHMREYARAERYYAMALRLDPDDSRCMLYRAEMCILLGQRDKGVALARQALEHASHDSTARDVVDRGKRLLKYADGGA